MTERTRRARRPATDYALGAWTAAALVFLFAPIVIAIIYAFNKGLDGRQSPEFTGWTTQWFVSAWENQSLRSAIGVSLRVAAVVAVIATLVGILTALAMVRHPSRSLRATLQTLVYLLLIVPEVVLGVSLLLFYTKVHVPLGIAPLIAAHTPSTIAVVALIVRSRVLALDRTIEESAADLGARPWQVTRDVIVPQLSSAILASLILSFTFSFDDVVISSFLTTPTVNTLPVYLFGTLNYGTEPNVYAAVAVLLAFNLTVLGATGLVYRRLNGRQRADRDVAVALV
jgi:ABC-type spermidine/putrescine transport system permease subunit II